jgi:hypothetical protein
MNSLIESINRESFNKGFTARVSSSVRVGGAAPKGRPFSATRGL